MANYFALDNGAYRNNRRTSVDVRVVREVGTTEPVTAEEVRNYLRLDFTFADEPQEEALINNMITTARHRVERFINSDIISKERELHYTWLEGDINLMYAPLDSSVTVTVSVDGESTTAFELNGLDNPKFRLETVPTENVQISYTTAGRSENEIKQAVLSCVGDMYYTREQARAKNVYTNWKVFASPFKIIGYYGVR